MKSCILGSTTYKTRENTWVRETGWTSSRKFIKDGKWIPSRTDTSAEGILKEQFYCSTMKKRACPCRLNLFTSDGKEYIYLSGQHRHGEGDEGARPGADPAQPHIPVDGNGRLNTAALLGFAEENAGTTVVQTAPTAHGTGPVRTRERLCNEVKTRLEAAISEALINKRVLNPMGIVDAVNKAVGVNGQVELARNYVANKLAAIRGPRNKPLTLGDLRTIASGIMSDHSSECIFDRPHVEVLTSDSRTEVAVLITSRRLAKIFLKFPVIGVDATYNFLKGERSRKVIQLCAQDMAGKMHVLFAMISPGETTNHYSMLVGTALKLSKDWFPEIPPRAHTIVCDGMAAAQSIAARFNLNLLSCYFHCTQSCRRAFDREGVAGLPAVPEVGQKDPQANEQTEPKADQRIVDPNSPED
jgi:hypothetical protein